MNGSWSTTAISITCIRRGARLSARGRSPTKSLVRRGGVSVVSSGHEHNFQRSQDTPTVTPNGVRMECFVSGAGGQVRLAPPTDFVAANTLEWASEAHFLLVKIAGDTMTVTPMGEHGPIQRRTPSGDVLNRPIVIRR